jgi:gluconolactonase
MNMNPFAPLERIPVSRFTALPDALRDPRRCEWADANKRGEAVHSFLEGPCFDAAGNLWCTDIPFGRIFRISPSGEWTTIAEYDGWPNGMKIARDGRVFVTDARHGIMTIDPATGAVTPFLRAYRAEGFKGVNDLTFAANGDLYFTDQGQTGMQDPTGRVFRVKASGEIDLLCDRFPSPNGLALDLAERVLFVAVTRANAIWRVPLFERGISAKVGGFIQLSGGGGPDGIALDEDGGLVVAHLGMGVWRFDRLGLPTHFIGEPGAFVTNIAFGGPDRRTLYMTESETGEILTARMPFPGKIMASPL